jgi:hypothetical protein
VNNGEQFASDFVDGRSQRPIKHLRVHVQRRIHVGVTQQLCDHFAWHPFSCDQDEYVRRNVSQVACGSPIASHAGKIARLSTLLGEIVLPIRMANTRSSSCA